MQLHIAGAFELLVNHFVHPAARVQQAGGDDGQGAAFLQVARRPDEPLGGIQGRRVNAAGHCAPRGGQRQVVGPRQPGNAVQQDDHIKPGLRHPLGPFHGQLGHAALLLNGFVKGRGEHVAFHGAAHLRDFLRPLADQHHHQQQLGPIFGDGGGNLPQDGGLAGFGRRHHQPPLPQPDGGKEVNHPRGQPAQRVFQRNVLVGENGRQRLENAPRAGLLLLRVQQVDLGRAYQFVVVPALPVFGRTHQAGDGVPGFEVMAPDLRLLHIGVPGNGRVLQGAHQPMPGVHHFQHARSLQPVPAGGGQAHFVEQEFPVAVRRRVVGAGANFGGQLQQPRNGHRGQLGNVHRLSFRGVRERRGRKPVGQSGRSFAVGRPGRTAAGTAGRRGRCGRSRADHSVSLRMLAASL